MSPKSVTALTIAGSDPSGGAGIQADLRVFAACDVVGLAAITALTVQNSQGVHSVHPVAPEILAAQIEAVLSERDVDAVKIGMLGGEAQVRVVAQMLRRFKPPNIVLDPVLASTGGVPLLEEAGRQALLTELMPLCDLITPNVPELGLLTEMPVQFAEERYTAARKLLSRGARNVLITGGHLRRNPMDVLLMESGELHRFRTLWIATKHTHGTGCFLSSAIAAYLTRHKTLPYVVQQSKHLLSEALDRPVAAGRGRGFPDALAGRKAILEPIEHYIGLPHFFRRRLSGLYVLTDSDLRPDRAPLRIVEEALLGGAKIIQLREKRLPTPQWIDLAQQMVRMTREAGATFIVNDRVDVALAADADGVHLGPEDMDPGEARRLLGPRKILGVSVSTVEEAREKARYASYLAVGAIFGSKTKPDAGDPVGVERIREIKQAFPEYPVVAIGGISAENIAAVAAAGADAAAVISAVVAAPDMHAATADLVQRFHAHGCGA
jgi:hydroxymethylpyrimidine kinase/phosphomethylpyrimidine kinase/thiamine-phosphate diphosphorylase